MSGRKRPRDEPSGRPHADRPRFSKADEGTMAYFKEIQEHMASLDDDSEKQLLADNALEEAVGKEVEVATDASCSRVVEALLACASLEKAANFLTNCVQGDNLGAICTSGPFGSHVLEKAIVRVAAAAASADEAGYALAEGALSAVADATAASLYDMITSKYGSFVARRLLCVLCGRDVSAPAAKRQSPPGAGPEGGAPLTATPSSARPGGLGLRVGQSGEAGASWLPEPPFPEVLRRLASAMLGDEWGGYEVSALQCDAFAGPFLQALLRSCAHDDELRGALALRMLGGRPAAGPDSVTPDALLRLLTDRQGSHLMEAVFETAPEELLTKLCTAAFRGRAAQMAHHPSANFALQAALAALRRPQQLKRLFQDLRPEFAALLRARRAGVVAVLVAAAGRLAALQADCAAALWHAAEAGLGAHSPTPLHALLTLDTTTTLGEAGGGGRLSPLGCSALVSVMRYPPADSKVWADALAALPAAELCAVARDPGGCRVLEAYLQGAGAAPKKRRRMLQALAGAWAGAAATGAGCRFVQACYELAEPAEKEAIAVELAAAEQRLAGSSRGAGLLRACQVDAYKSGGDGWLRRLAAAEAARREFADIFADGGGQEGEGDGAERGGAARLVPGKSTGEAAAEAQRRAQRKAEKRAKRAAAAAEASGKHPAADPAGGEQAAPEKAKKKGKQRDAATGAEGGSTVHAVLAQLGFPAAPKSKGKGNSKRKAVPE